MPSLRGWRTAAIVAGVVVAGACTAPGDAGNHACSPERFALGRAATAQDIAALDIAIGPEGAGLPPGSGSAADGAKLYAQKCASCHGDNGQGMPPAYPALIGRDPKGEGFVFASDPKLVRTIGNYWPNATTIFDYVRRAMPFAQPGSLSSDETYAITAYLLAANKVIPDSVVLDARSLVNVKMPYAGRFVPDDRTGGPVVR